MRIAFIGGGNMATALISSLFASRHNVDRVNVADPGTGVRERLQKRWPVICFERAADALEGMDAIVLAVKPQILPVVLEEIIITTAGISGATQRMLTGKYRLRTAKIRSKPRRNIAISRACPEPEEHKVERTDGYSPGDC